MTSHGGQGMKSPWPQTIKNMVESGRLRAQTFSREAVAAVWNKAVDSARDAELGSLSIDSSLRLAYDAGHMGALSLLAVHGPATWRWPGTSRNGIRRCRSMGLRRTRGSRCRLYGN